MADAPITLADSTTALALATDIGNDSTRGHGSAHIGYKPASGDGMSVQSALDLGVAAKATADADSVTLASATAWLGATNNNGTAFAQIAALKTASDTAVSDIGVAESAIDALEAQVGTSAGTGTVYQQLTALNSLTGVIAGVLNNGTGTGDIFTGILVVPHKLTITKAWICFEAVTNYTFKLTNYDLSATTADNLLDTTSIVLDSDEAGNDPYTCTVLNLTHTEADLQVDEGDYIFITIKGGSAGNTAGTGGVFTLEYTLGW
jgi:hypothetical protein